MPRRPSPTVRAYEAQDFDRLYGATGFSDALLETHFGLHRGYVENANLALDAMRNLEGPAVAEVRRRFAWEHNGMRLHEAYFGGLVGGSEPSEAPRLQKAIAGAFGSLAAWRRDVRAAATMRGVGWAMPCADPATGVLHNAWVEEHAAGLLAGTTPVVVLDAFEHAFMRDFGTDRGKYVDALLEAVDWQGAEQRPSKAWHGAARRRRPDVRP